ncbi:UPF0481 protein [Salix suchowensis]|nr:UPF0481 protein [Salix suchowensis]
MENDIEQARASNMEVDKATPNMENDIEQARASNMENDIEQARASNMEEDRASSPNKGKDINMGSASYIEMAKDILGKLYTDVGQMPWQRNGSESRRSECSIYRFYSSMIMYSKDFIGNY